ncbi:Single-pass membrane and coiled-coil domain-containing protein 4 [Bagarius yarrelli]|uniref:Single-pass membrane and coiled-coil domain-containing protein 4 n=2 Tax=Siluroidei TaxID=1489793 RepID=A0A556TTR4_BAGYA|nr:Single-pass membrane and coiled-coil domain-containing protein 4 [Bagarius yarrelli]
MKPRSAGFSLPESFSLLHRRLLVAEGQGAELAKKLGVSGDELGTELMDGSQPEALVARVFGLENLLHALRLSEQCEEEQRSWQREVKRLRERLQQERDETQREANTLREQLHTSYRSQMDVAAAADELKKVKVQLSRKLHQMKEAAAQETAARLEAEQSHDALLQRVKKMEEEVEKANEQVKLLQTDCHTLDVDGQEARAELKEKAELMENLQEVGQQLRRELEAQCSDLSSALRSLTEEKKQLQASLKMEQERTAQLLKDMDLQLDTARRNMQCELQEALAERRRLDKELETLRADHTKVKQSSAAALDAAVNHQVLLDRTITRLRGELSDAIKDGETMQQEKEGMLEECVAKLNEERDEMEQKMKEVRIEFQQISENLQEAHCWFRAKFHSLKSGPGLNRAPLPEPGSENKTRQDCSEAVCAAEPELERWASTLQRWEMKKELDRMANGLANAMRQLKGKPKKESWKDKKERKQAMQEAREQVATVVLPTLAILILLIVLFVYVATRPGAVQ